MIRRRVMHKEEGDVPWLLSGRLWLAFLICLGLVFFYSQRVGMSVAIVCMVNHTALQQHRQYHLVNSSQYKAAVTDKNYTARPTEETGLERTLSIEHDDGPFVWNKELQGHVLGAFFYGYIVSQIPAGLLAERFGGKWVLALFYLLSTVGTLLTPIAANLHYGVLLAVRVSVGFGSGGLIPVIHSMWGKWAPPLERSILCGISYSGPMLGSLLAMSLSGVLCDDGFSGGWPSIFYVFGILSFAWLLLWVLLVSSHSRNCKIISKKEKSYILQSLQDQAPNRQHVSIPWFSVLTSPAVWAIVVANFAFDWGLNILITSIPTYMYEVLHLDIQSNGLYSSLPFIGMWVNLNMSPILADKLRSSGVLSTRMTRKVFTGIGHFGASVCLVGLSYMNCSNAACAATLLTLTATIAGSSLSGYFVNHMDIAPKYAGSLVGLTNSIAATSGFIAPYVASVMTTNQTRAEWQKVFFLSAGIYAFGALVFIVFASGELQPWAVVPSGTDHTVHQILNGEIPERCELLNKCDTKCKRHTTFSNMVECK